MEDRKLSKLEHLGSVYDKKLSINNYLFEQTGSIPYLIKSGNLNPKKISSCINSEFLEFYSDVYLTELSNKDYYSKESWYKYKNTDIAIQIYKGPTEANITIAYYKDKDKAFKIADEFVKFKNKSKKSSINLINFDGKEFKLVSIDLPKIKINLELNYGKNFLEKDKCIIDSIKGKDSGIILLHSIPGMGKSSYIQYLCNRIKRNFIFLPVSLSSFITNPSFIGFLKQWCSNSILIIEDAELLLKSRELVENGAIADILNITDGLLGKALNIKIIATYNTNKAQIDEALMRKGRLLCEHEFIPLNHSDSVALCKEFYPDREFELKDNNTLADLYNLDKENFRKKVKRTIVGFKC